ncbi:MAG TPA: ribosome biogenesis GTPase Der [Ktedonobacterales bacterium]|jgi:GTP-binding protein
MKPLVAIVGRPNVGKSTLFNRLVGERLAIVEDLPGTTRDRLYADAEWNGRVFSLVDTGGLELGTSEDITARIASQAQLAIEEADVIVLLVDTKSGITEADAEVANILRRSGKPVVLGANKADNLTRRQEAVEFYSLGLGEPITLAANSGTGTGDLLDAITEHLPPAEEEDEAPSDGIPRLAIVGRPNVGKSSLLNAIAGSDRVIVSNIPGTTRDAIDTEVEYKGRRITLIDTAGIRRRGHIGPGVEKYSVLRADRAIDRCDVAVLMIDAVEGITAQDTHIAGYINEAAKGIVIVINKWDIIKERRRLAETWNDPDVPILPSENVDLAALEVRDAEAYMDDMREKLKFVPYAPLVFAAAKTKYHVNNILDHALRIYDTRSIRVPTSQLNDIVRDAVQRHHPPSVQGRPLRIFYVTQAETNPPTFVFFVNDPELLHFSYRRYLENQLRNVFGFEGTAIRLQFRARTTDRGEEDEKKGKDKGKSRPGQKYTGKRPTTRTRR